MKRCESQNRQAIFTIVSNNYLHFARTLLHSVREFHSDAEIFCVIVDSDMTYSAELADEFTTITLDQLALPLGDIFLFQYNVLELNTAVKPWAFEYLMQSFDQVIYIDPDIRLYKRMNEVNALLDEGTDIVLTPHLLAPIDDDKKPTELDIRRAGTYNFGFCALASTANSLRFLKWWQGKLERECIIDMDRGIFVDQSWIDLVPGMFDRVTILRHPGYNVAYWNLAQRKVEAGRFRRWTVNGEPLVFFHYSGLNPLNPEPFSKHQNRFTLGNMGKTRRLVDDYGRLLLKNGAATYSKVPYGFGKFDNGETIPIFFAELYRNELALQKMLGEQPFSRGESLCKPARTNGDQSVTWAMLAVWRLRPDLQSAFPLDTAESIWAYRMWFAYEGGNYFSERVADWHRNEVLKESQANVEAAARGVPTSPEVVGQPQSAEPPEHVRAIAQIGLEYERKVQTVVDLFYSMLHRFPEMSAIETYCAMLNRSFGFIRVWRAIAFSSEHMCILGWRRQALRALFAPPSAPTHLYAAMAAYAAPARIAGQEAQVAESTEPTFALALAAEPQTFWHAQRASGRDRMSSHGGIYFEEGINAEGFWTQPLSWFSLPAEAGGKTLSVSGNVIPSLLEQATGSAENAVALYLNDKFVAETTSGDGRFELTTELPTNLGRYPAIMLVNREYFVPSSIGLGADQRQLALRLNRIEVGDEILFDSAREVPLREMAEADVTPPGINIVGYVRAELGVGEAARSLAAAALASNTPYSLIDVGFQTSNRQTDSSASKGAVDETQPIDLVFVNADQTPSALQYLAQIRHKADYRIGFWHWEQPIFPKRWRSNFAGLDEIWVPTAFVHEAVSAVAPIPVVKVPDAVHFTIPKTPQRKKFGLPERGFVALVMYDFHSYVYRKNPQAAVEAFRRAMSDRKDATLVIKIINADQHANDYARLKKDVRGLNVVFVDKFLSRRQVYELQACCDVLLSLHRAEGFGLAPAEMMFIGKPVIATGWSGNMDFMTPMNSYPVDYELKPLDETYGVYEKGPLWAEPDVDHAAWCLRQVIEQHTDAQTKAKRGAADVRRLLSPEAVGAQVRDRLNLIARMRGID